MRTRALRHDWQTQDGGKAALCCIAADKLVGEPMYRPVTTTAVLPLLTGKSHYPNYGAFTLLSKRKTVAILHEAFRVTCEDPNTLDTMAYCRSAELSL
jgi:hypothetical protein